ncbi:hypothetical protein SAMN05660649_04600 [Desulfotomaculum arcticum]|uniref:Uncharacterized protein n=1 Tax=Desulfotruncus arcticus DSM 17038 TaxID=1121424 RepID=A0A1I2YUZ5_9FIRM|nr:hypothetical protein SAMN05660649_04600 [Desulfotomaculum arcticum] [Desulfotruncus arcticus DSM 17038]
MDAIRSLSTMPERFPFLNAEFIPLNKYKDLINYWVAVPKAALCFITKTLTHHVKVFVLLYSKGVVRLCQKVVYSRSYITC